MTDLAPTTPAVVHARMPARRDLDPAGPEHGATARADADGNADPDADRTLIARRTAAFLEAISVQAEQPNDQQKGPL